MLNKIYVKQSMWLFPSLLKHISILKLSDKTLELLENLLWRTSDCELGTLTSPWSHEPSVEHANSYKGRNTAESQRPVILSNTNPKEKCRTLSARTHRDAGVSLGEAARCPHSKAPGEGRRQGQVVPNRLRQCDRQAATWEGRKGEDLHFIFGFSWCV